MPQSYRLDELGWYQFEHLCQALLKAAHGIAVENWAGPGDHGRDAYCHHALPFPNAKVTSPGPFVFQAKFIDRANARGAAVDQPVLDAVNAELRRIDNRRTRGLWDDPQYYVFITNAPLSPELRERLRPRMETQLPTTAITLLGGSDVERMMDDNPRVRLAFPQVLGLRDLRQLINDAVTRDVQTRSIISLDHAATLASVFETTRPFFAALDRLRRHAFVFLTGPPEMGKTSIATIIALALHTQDWQAFECNSPSELFSVYDPEAKQVFVADDAFGATEYRPDRADAWARDMNRILSRTGKSHWVIFTSRTSPLRQALTALHFPGVSEWFPKPADVTVNSESLTIEEKARIAYRHCKAADFDESVRHFVRKNARRIVQSPHFTPLRIKRLVWEQLPSIMQEDEGDKVAALEEAIETAIEEPTRAMRTSFNALDAEDRRTLVALLDVSDYNVDLEYLDAARRRLYWDEIEQEAEVAVRRLDEHFLRLTEAE